MSLFDKRSPEPSRPAPRRFTCNSCAFFSFDAEYTFAHMRLHRTPVATVAAPGATQSPMVQRALQAAERGEGLHRGHPRKPLS